METQTQAPINAVQQVPFVRHSGFELVAAGPGWAIAAADQRPQFTSHVGTFQGAAIYGLAETAVSTVLAGIAGPDLMATDIIIAAASIGFDKAARDHITAHATLSESAERIKTRLDRDGATSLAVVVRIRDESGAEVGRAEFSCRMTRRERPRANVAAS